MADKLGLGVSPPAAQNPTPTAALVFKKRLRFVRCAIRISSIVADWLNYQ
jgi:hypothetical protein